MTKKSFDISVAALCLTVLLGGVTASISTTAYADSFATGSRIKGFGGKCLDLPYGNLRNGTDLHMWQCSGTRTGNANQLWSSYKNTLKLRKHCMDGEGPTKNWGTPAQIWDCAFGASNQRWTMTVAGEIISNYSGQCLDVYAWNKSNGADVVLWPCNGQGNQKWRLIDAPDQTTLCSSDVGWGTKYIHSVTWDFTPKGLVIRIDPTHTGMAFLTGDKGNVAEAWRQVKACTPERYKSWSFDSAASDNIKQQFKCHAHLALNPHNSGFATGGKLWELESFHTLSGNFSDWVSSKCGNRNSVRIDN